MSLDVLAEVAGDIQYWKQDLQETAFDTAVKRQLEENLLPILERIVEATGFELAEHAQAITSLIDEEEIIHLELAQKIVGTLALGRFICQTLADENILEGHEKLQEAIKVYMAKAPEVEAKVAEITAVPEGEDDEDPDEEDITPVETPRKSPSQQTQTEADDQDEETDDEDQPDDTIDVDEEADLIEEGLDDFIDEEEIA